MNDGLREDESFGATANPAAPGEHGGPRGDDQPASTVGRIWAHRPTPEGRVELNLGTRALWCDVLAPDHLDVPTVGCCMLTCSTLAEWLSDDSTWERLYVTHIARRCGIPSNPADSWQRLCRDRWLKCVSVQINVHKGDDVTIPPGFEGVWNDPVFQHQRTKVTVQSTACVPPEADPAVDPTQSSALVFEWVIDQARAAEHLWPMSWGDRGSSSWENDPQTKAAVEEALGIGVESMRTPSDEAIRALVRMCESHLSKGAFDMCKSSVGTQRCECRSREEGSGVYSITQVQADSADWPTAHNCCARRSATSTQWTRVVLMGSPLTAETHCFSCGGNSQF